ncbi:MAG TPA: dTDP-4-dehydrorhamnose 3,5-epimerase family protein [Vicingus sp.]|nr:dTDP-4-dehydrorhamnose 3,5-epimerase family protein [Vicingus sp.]
MQFIETEIEGLLIIKPKIFEDERGHFFESYNKEVFKKLPPETIRKIKIC